MPASVGYALSDLQRISRERLVFDLGTFPERPQTPANFQVDGRKLSFYVTWAKVDGVDGYQLAVMTGNDLANPQIIIEIPGKDTMQYSYTVGDTAVARTFSLQSYKNFGTGGRLYSEWFYPLRTATSKVDGGAADAAPIVPPAPAPTPDTVEYQGDIGGVVDPRQGVVSL